MRPSDEIEKVNIKELDVISIFRAEREYLGCLGEGNKYDDKTLGWVKDMQLFIEDVTMVHLFKAVTVTTQEEAPDYYSNQVDFYCREEQRREEQKIFPCYNFFIRERCVVSYPGPYGKTYEIHPVFGDYDTNVHPYYNKDLYSTFFAFKLRNISIHYINAFLDYQLEKFNEKEESLSTFLELLLIQYKKIIPKPSRKICKKWLNENNINNNYGLKSSVKVASSKTISRRSFDNILKEPFLTHTLKYLLGKQFIEKLKGEKQYKWIGDEESVFIGFFWALKDLSDKSNTKMMVNIPRVSKIEYQIAVFNFFKITQWKDHRFEKVSKHRYKIKDKRKELLEELEKKEWYQNSQNPNKT